MPLSPTSYSFECNMLSVEKQRLADKRSMHKANLIMAGRDLHSSLYCSGDFGFRRSITWQYIVLGCIEHVNNHG